MEERLAANGWNDRAKAIVVDPELESWVWADSRVVEDVLGWPGHAEDLRSWLCSNEFLRVGESKRSLAEGAAQM